MDPKRILMVDDDGDYAAGIRLVLGSRGYAFFHAADPETGLTRLEEAAPDMIILDVVMGNRTGGFLFAKELRSAAAHARFARTPILLLTGMRRQPGEPFAIEGDEAVFLPGDEFLEKPVSPELLLRTVSRMTGG
ncbi:MAG: hypothetical protein A2X36_01090 [Elusimicrobia bacterium GWA2_69_24]|nr:MAG: hypothetical protein A2X36_01090 [Elusimicrobia bacterium GWA2_69_24]